MAGNVDGEFSRRVQEMRAEVQRERMEECELAKRSATAQNLAFANLRKAMALRFAARPDEFAAVLEVVADASCSQLRLRVDTERNQWNLLSQREGGSWYLDGYSGCWDPEKEALDDWCIAVLSGRIEEEEIPF